jgi:hypothetical protein
MKSLVAVSGPQLVTESDFLSVIQTEVGGRSLRNCGYKDAISADSHHMI